MKDRKRWLVVVLMGAATFPLTGSAQGAAAKLPAWDVISVRPSPTPCGGPSSLMPTQDGIEIECLSLQNLLKITFEINEDSRILGVPGWVKEAPYNIVAKVGGEDAATYAKLDRTHRSLMLQDLLMNRFAMKWHRETRDLPVYALVVVKGGSKLKESRSDEKAKGAMWSKGTGEIDALASSLNALPMFLTRELDRPVVDRTGLTGTYDFTLRFAPGPDADSDAASIFTAVQEQLGLKLEPSKAPLEVLVIDHIEKPSAN